MAPSSPAVAAASILKDRSVAAFQLAVIAPCSVGAAGAGGAGGIVFVGIGCGPGPVSVGAVHAGSAATIENAKRPPQRSFMDTI
jgi:hypothetical protein